MTYRDELEAARARVASLESARFDSEHTALAERRKLQARITELERTLVTVRGMPAPEHVWILCGIAPAAMVLLYGLAFLAVTGSSEAGAWEMSHAAIVAGLILPAWSWGRAHRLAPCLLALAFKLAVLGAWIGPWWSPFKSGIRHVPSSLGTWDADFYFFWWAAPFVFAVCVVEAVIVRWLLIRAPSTTGS